jgi:hypothetical protein
LRRARFTVKRPKGHEYATISGISEAASISTVGTQAINDDAGDRIAAMNLN